MSGPLHESADVDRIAAILVAAVLGAGLALFLKGVSESRNYSPVAEAQRVARKALGLDG